MKIRMKSHCEEMREVSYYLDYSPRTGYRWSSLGFFPGELILYHEDDWEEAPIERWVPISSWTVERDGTRYVLNVIGIGRIVLPYHLRVEAVDNTPGQFTITRRVDD
jgi:hypothetical protein